MRKRPDLKHKGEAALGLPAFWCCHYQDSGQRGEKKAVLGIESRLYRLVDFEVSLYIQQRFLEGVQRVQLEGG